MQQMSINALIQHLEVQRGLHGGDVMVDMHLDVPEPSQRDRPVAMQVGADGKVTMVRMVEQEGVKKLVLVG